MNEWMNEWADEWMNVWYRWMNNACTNDWIRLIDWIWEWMIDGYIL